MDKKEFLKHLKNATQEEEVKFAFANYFNIKTIDTSNRFDLYTKQVLFEFKKDKNFENVKAISTILAQTLYYVRRLKYELVDESKPIPPIICMADMNEVVLTETIKWKNYYSNDLYDWERAPSKPDIKLVDDLSKDKDVHNIHIFKIFKAQEHKIFQKHLSDYLNPQIKIAFPDKKIITEENFEAVFEHWNNKIGNQIDNGFKSSRYFLADIQPLKTLIDESTNRVSFIISNKDSRTHRIMMKDYNNFWDLYEKVEDIDTISGINAKLDRLTDEETRRFEGEFYTPLRFAKKALHYIEEVVGKEWWKSGKVRLWDMAAGTGNLEYHLPYEAYQYMYISTLHEQEAKHSQRIFPTATCFQYDYLHDDVEYLFIDSELPYTPKWKLPQNLIDDLNNEDLTWIVLINPPFGTAQTAGEKGESKEGISFTKINLQMEKNGYSHSKRELFAQFMFRVVHEMPKTTFFCMFSKIKYLNAPDSQELREKLFPFKLEKGFIFNSKTFSGVRGKYPIGFSIWNLGIKESDIKRYTLDISNNEGINVGTKDISVRDKSKLLNNWFKRPSNTSDYILPPLSGSINVNYTLKDPRHRARPDFIASIVSNGNDIQHHKNVCILSSPYGAAGGFTVIPEIFEKSLILHTVRKIFKPTWSNDRNQFYYPEQELPTDFIYDCILWSLFAKSNETTAQKDVEYKGKIYQIKNHFFPFPIEELKRWKITEPEFKQQLGRDSDRFVAKWFNDKKLSKEANNLLEAGRELYKFYFANLFNLQLKDYKISSWDAGWYQIRMTLNKHNLASEELEDVKKHHDELRNKILPKLWEYNFIDKDELFDKL